MSNIVAGINPERGGEYYMQADRDYFEKHPNEECYLRKRFLGEPVNCPDPVSYIVVFNFEGGVRLRIPYKKSYLSKRDIERLKRIYKKPIRALKKVVKEDQTSRNRSRRAKKSGGGRLR